MGKRPEDAQDIQIKVKCMKRYSTSYVNREMQSKITMRYYIPIRMAKIQNTKNTKWHKNKMHYFLTQRGVYRINLFYNVMGYKVNKVLWKNTRTI